ncbi:poly-gamma-glutamate hydrolase family protein [Proteus sp. WDL240414]|uniref:poly-gamma-glutamate hydrolase family protein n=1 Tax=Proteus sp. WDL240414 TaxID=3399621 RepID=UPI003A4D1E85
MNSDTYSCFVDLEKNEDQANFNIKCKMENRSEIYAIMAPHGGKIEQGTTGISIAIAREDLSLYIFNGNKPKNNGTLHITSSRFDEPQCEKILENVQTVLAIHGAKDPETEPKERVWVGGNLGKIFETHLIETLSSLELCIEINSNLLGENPKNICNRGISQRGMQLELTKSLRDRLNMDKEFLEHFSDSVRRAMMLAYPSS